MKGTRDPRVKKVDQKKAEQQIRADEERQTRAQFVRLTANENWATTDEIVDKLDDNDFWADEFLEDAERSKKRAYVRREIKQLKSEDDDFPIFEHLKVQSEDGNFEDIYKQTAIFDRDDYHQVKGDYEIRVNTVFVRCVGLNRRYFSKFGEQLQFAFMYPVDLPDPEAD